jgi:hypothetical protein
MNNTNTKLQEIHSLLHEESGHDGGEILLVNDKFKL